MALKNYRRFLQGLRDELAEAIADAENLEWHHMGEATPGWRHYQRLVTWQVEVEERMDHYDDIKAERRVQERLPETQA